MDSFFRGAAAAAAQVRARVHHSSADAPLLGKTLDVQSFRGLKVERVLASGGFGFVYVAVDQATLREYALKHVMPGDSPEALAVVRTEVEVGESLAQHPNAVRLLAAQPHPPQPRADCLLLMEKGGASLADMLRSQPAGLPEQEVLVLCLAVASVLAALHGNGVWHWDVKPENLLRFGGVTSQAVWKLCDFGSAVSRPAGPAAPRERGRLEDDIQRRTTPAYRSPELWDLDTHGALGPAADIWALGCLLGAALGAPPFCETDKLRILAASYKSPERASWGVAALQQRMLAASPAARPSATDVLAALDQLLTPPSAAVPPPLPPRPQAAKADDGPGWCASFD
jgi:AP2-associated kinase